VSHPPEEEIWPLRCRNEKMSDDDDKPEIEYTHEEMLEVEEEVSRGLKELEKGKLGSSAQQQKSALLTKRVEKLKVRAQRE
jgi:hypothetical protein